MTSLTRGVGPSTKKVASTAEAPIWSSYLAIRLLMPRNDASPAAVFGNQNTRNGNLRIRKRARPLSYRGDEYGYGIGIWMTLGTPSTTQRNGREDGDAVLTGIRTYWKQLSVNERQQILLLDEPEIVKQLYKLNLSLLCVGLMQRHLKTSSRAATIGTNNSEKVGNTAMAAKASPSLARITTKSEHPTSPSTCTPIDTSQETAYELLEAMEFMDIGTGILTVKTELVEATDHLFTLVGDVLAGFLTSLHVLTESNFLMLFVTESETINTWANYQRLIAMLLEQLILRSYVSYLEKEAAHRMAELLLEVSLEDKASENVRNTFLQGKKKSKKKKKKKSTILARSIKGHCSRKAATGSSDRIFGEVLANLNDKGMVEEPFAERVPGVKVETDCQSNSSTTPTDDGIMDDRKRSVIKEWSSLNPNALEFQPQGYLLTVEDTKSRTSLAGKRKFDDYIVSVPWEDVESDADSAIDLERFDRDLSDIEDEDDKDAHHQWQRNPHRREENAKLEWQLRQVYSSTSSLFGWDFSRQCEMPDSDVNYPWSERTLWRTAPKEVVRFFSSNTGDAYSRFHASHYIPTPRSRYYFKADQPFPFGPPELIPPHFHQSLGFQNAVLYSLVVSSPDFSSAQYHPSNLDDQQAILE